MTSTSRPVRITDGDVALAAEPSGRLLLTERGQTIAVVHGLRLGRLQLVEATPTLETGDTGETILLPYLSIDTGASASARATLRGGCLRIEFEVAQARSSFWPGDSAVLRTVPGADQRLQVPLWWWREDERGGVPIQTPVGHATQWRFHDDRILAHEFVRPQGAAALSTTGECHVPAETISDQPWQRHFRFTWTLCPGDAPLATVAALAAGRDAAVSVRTGRPFHWFEADAADVPFEVTAWRATSVPAELHWQVRSWDGDVEAEGSQPVSGAAPLTRVRCRAASLARGPHFVRAWLDESGTTRAVDRAVFSVLPPFAGVEGPSPFGLSACRPEAGKGLDLQRTDWLRLMHRMGVRRLRNDFVRPDEAMAWDLTVNIHHSQSWTDHRRDDGSIDEPARHAQHRHYAGDCLRNAAPWDEYANEWNGEGGFLTGHNAGTYVHDYLEPYHRVLEESGATTRLCAMGLAGPDVEWLRAFEREGGWPLVDAIALHPGRGNFTPDWAPPRDEWHVSPTGSYWNFLGGLRAIRELRDEFDAKHRKRTQLLLSEVYAPSYPNSWWEDTPRIAAENTLLTCALALSEDVHSLYWYQLQDGVWFDLDAANDADREWHFGLVQVDGSLKPMAHAYSVAAELLAEARFLGWLDLPWPLRGLAFETPDGLLQIVWHRQEGFLLNADHQEEQIERAEYTVPTDQGGQSFYPTQEPWVEAWSHREPLRLAASGPVTVVDCIGRRTELTTDGEGHIDVSLTGAPLCVLGADLAAPLTDREAGRPGESG